MNRLREMHAISLYRKTVWGGESANMYFLRIFFVLLCYAVIAVFVWDKAVRLARKSTVANNQKYIRLKKYIRLYF